MRDVPDEIGPYTILERIGRGGMGVVYRAKKNTGEVVALKVMRPDLAQNFAFVRRFQREARIAQELDSPHVVRVLDSGGEDDTRYIAMEYVEGQTLAAMLRESGPLPPEDAEDIAIRVARGLAAAHAKGVTHRDISPQNIMLTADGTVKIADFGIARATGYTTLTATGLFMGKPSYAAPETAAGVADIRSDIYALGVVLFEMLSGRPPFTAPTPIAAMEMHARVPPPRLRDLGVQTPPYLEEILQRCLRKDPAERYQTPDQLVTALETRDPTGTITGITRPAAPGADATVAVDPGTAGTTPVTPAGAPPAAPGGAGGAPPAAPAAPAAPGGRFPYVLLAVIGGIGAVAAVVGIVLFLVLGDGDDGTPGVAGGPKATESSDETRTPRPTGTPRIEPTVPIPPAQAVPPGPVPRLLRIEAPSTVEAGDIITITVGAVNEGDDAEGGSISVSLPDDPELISRPVPDNSKLVNDDIGVYREADCTSDIVRAKDVLAESYWGPQDDGWPSGLRREMSFRLKVSDVDMLELEVRVSMKELGNPCIRTHPGGSQTDDRDQQDYPVIVRRIIVE